MKSSVLCDGRWIAPISAMALFAGLLLGAGSAFGRAGTAREEKLYADYMTQSGVFVCPKDTKRTFEDRGQGIEESCTTQNGVRHGYFLRWHRDGDHWAQLGQYENGIRTGVWRLFAVDGSQIAQKRHSRHSDAAE